MSTKITKIEPETATIIDSPDSNTTYVGEAKIGASTSDAVWQIMKLEKTGNEFYVKLANSSLRFNQIWDNRVSLTYGI